MLLYLFPNDWSMSTTIYLEYMEKNKLAQNEKNYIGFHIPKIWQTMKHFASSFHQA